MTERKWIPDGHVDERVLSTRYPNVERGRLSPAENAEVCRLAERGLKSGQIALRMNRHPGTINFAMYRLGLKTPTLGRRREYSRKGLPVKSFSAEEDAYIQALCIQEFKYRKIAELVALRFGYARTPATIRTRLVMLANRDDEAA